MSSFTTPPESGFTQSGSGTSRARRTGSQQAGRQALTEEGDEAQSPVQGHLSIERGFTGSSEVRPSKARRVLQQDLVGETFLDRVRRQKSDLVLGSRESRSVLQQLEAEEGDVAENEVTKLLEGSATQEFYSLLAGLSYESRENIPSIISQSNMLNGRVEMMPEFSGVNTEFKAFLHRGPQESDNEIVLSVRGSQFGTPWRTVEDWIKNNASAFALNMRSMSRRFQDARAMYERIKRAHPNTQVTLTGHSLGGAIAQWVAEMKGEDVMMINPATTPMMTKPPENVQIQMKQGQKKIPRERLAVEPRTFIFANKEDVVSGLSRFPTTRQSQVRHLILNDHPQDLPNTIMPKHSWKSLVSANRRDLPLEGASMQVEKEQGVGEINLDNTFSDQWFPFFD